MSSMVSSARQRVSRPANWAEFYKNGVPTEIIVLDDDDNEPDDDLERDHRLLSYHPSVSPDLSKQSASSYSKDSNSNDARPPGKRRRVSLNGGASVPSVPFTSPPSGIFHAQLPFTPTASSYSAFPSRSHDISSSTRQNAVNSVGNGHPPSQPSHPATPASIKPGNLTSFLAPIDINVSYANSTRQLPPPPASTITSALSPNQIASLNSSFICQPPNSLPIPPSAAALSSAKIPCSSATTCTSQSQSTLSLLEPVVGQKRKRVPRQTGGDDVKKRELDAALSHYCPPPKPPIRAKDVHVPIVRDYPTGLKEPVDDDDGHYNATPQSFLTDRYKIVRVLGQGTFGKVVEAIDLRTKSRCAVKVIRAVQKYRDASKIELRVLATLASNDVRNSNRCIHLKDCFDFRNHICIVTDLYGQSVFDFLKGNGFVPFPGSHIQKFAHQLLTSVAFLHDLNLIHTDLKPENILLVDHSYQTFTYNRPIPSSSTTINRTSRNRKVLLSPEIRLIDFGSATFDDEFHSTVVSTRHYRAPEIILELGWSYPCDMWSIACILVEFYTGDALFQTHDNLEHLAMMESVCNGPLDVDLVRAALRPSRSNGSAQVSEANYRLNYPNSSTTRTSRHYVNGMKRLHEFIPPTTSFNRQFLDLLRRLFVYNPKKRLTAKQALQHPWFKETLVDDGTEAERIKERRMVGENRK